MHYPDNLLYTQDHEWVLIEGNLATVGISDFAQNELGDIVYVEIESLGEEFDEHAAFGTVETTKATSDLFMPVAGKVIAVNESLADSPELVNTDPYGKGWLIKVDMIADGEISGLMNAADYKKMIGA